MELALEEALARGADAVEVYGALGGRLDHTVANLQLLASFAERGLAVAAVGERAAGAAGMLGKAGAVRSDVAEATSRALGSPPVGLAAAAAPVGAAPAVAGPREVRAVLPDDLR